MYLVRMRLMDKLKCDSVSAREFVDIDANVVATEEFDEDEIVKNILNKSDMDDDDVDDEQFDENDIAEFNAEFSLSQADDFLRKFECLIQSMTDVPDDVFNCLYSLQDFVSDKISDTLTQKKITDFF